MDSPVLTLEIILVLGILLFTIFLFISDVVRVDVVALIVLGLLGLSNVMPPEQLFSGFSSEAVISLISIMIISKGLDNSGLTERLVRFLLAINRSQTKRVEGLIMLFAGLMASFMRSFGTVAIFLPVINRFSQRTGLTKSRLLMPMAFCAILGGTLTMVGTAPLIMLNTLFENANLYASQQLPVSLASFHLFSVLPIGLLLLLIGFIYLKIFSRFLPDIKSSAFSHGTSKKQFQKIYGKGGDVFECVIGKKSELQKKTLQQVEDSLPKSLSLIALYQENNLDLPPLRNSVVDSRSVLALMGPRTDVEAFAETVGCKLEPKLKVFAENLHSSKAGLCEAVVPPSSQLVGQAVKELHMRRNHKAQVVALYRGTSVYQGEELKERTLHSGDTLGMFCRWNALAELDHNNDFVVITSSYPKEKYRPEKIKQALFFFIVTIGFVLAGFFPLSVSLLLGAGGMIATGVLSVDEAYLSVSWKTIFLLAGLIPLGLAIQVSGTADWLIGYLNETSNTLPVWVVQTLLAICATLLSLVVSNIGATVLLVPIAMELAVNIGTDPRIFALTVALASSNTFLIPTHQVNALIVGPGQYKLADFLKLGGGMTLLYWAVMLFALQWFVV